MNREATGLAGVRHKPYDTLGSTNAEALALARAGERGPLWISAKTQSAGRGRRGSTWVSPAGNLYATLLLTEPSEKAGAAQLSFVAALGLHDAIADCAPPLGPYVALKWPNDLLIAHKKAAGILIEAETAPVFSVAIGFGVNCSNHPADTEFPATDLKSFGGNFALAALLERLAVRMSERLAQWRRGENFADIRASWLRRAYGLDTEMRVRLPERELRGRFKGIDEAGRLLLGAEGQVVPVTAGEVFGL